MGSLSGAGRCQDGCGMELVVSSLSVREPQGLLWYVPQQAVCAPGMGLLIAQAPACPVVRDVGELFLLESGSCLRTICKADILQYSF